VILALIGIFVGNWKSRALIASALFERRKLSDFGNGTVWQNCLSPVSPFVISKN